ncbi:MAG: hypothetical protein LBK23_06500 [Oscillospiraceae bacterium]|jgi:hypothetical protein|nr:hypothetical protein [Oscillospiraceae bacterium]
MNHVQQLVNRFAAIPKIEETGPQGGAMNGRRMTALGRRTRLIHTALCAVGVLPLVLWLCGMNVSPKLVAVGFGLIVPGGGFMACGCYWSAPVGVAVCFYLWRRHGMMVQDRYGSLAGIVGYWVLGALGGVFSMGVTLWGPALAVLCAVVLFGDYELKTRKMYKRMKAARAERIGAFDAAVAELDAACRNNAAQFDELDDEQLLAVKFLLNATADRADGDFSGLEKPTGFTLADYRYQLSAFGYALMLYHAHYAPNFTGYLKRAHRFLVTGYTYPETCAYWEKQMLIGYGKRDADPIKYANVMLSGWMMPVIAGYHDQYGDDEFERPGAIMFKPRAGQEFPYTAKDCAEVLHRQFAGREFPYMLIPCEPHVAFPTCNSFGLLGLLMYDRDNGTHYCEDFWDELYDCISQEFTEIEGSMALRRQYQYGLRHIPASQLGYDPMADVQNYLHFLPIFPGYAKRGYANVRKHALKTQDGMTMLKDRPWDKVLDMITRQPNPSMYISALSMAAAEYGDAELLDGLRKAERRYCPRSKEPGSFRFKGVNTQTTVYLAFSRLCKQGYWSDVILKGMPETAKTGPILAECSYPDVLVAAAHSTDGTDLRLVLLGEGEQQLTLERLKPNTDYAINGGESFTADADGAATLTVTLRGRTELCFAVS